MNLYKFYKLKNKDSIIGFPFIALCETDSSYIDYTNGIISISPNFSDQHEADIDLYLDDYIPTTHTFSFDYNSLLSDLNIKSERQVTIIYHSDEPCLNITYHWLGTSPAYEEAMHSIPESAKKKLDNLIVLFSKMENQ